MTTLSKTLASGLLFPPVYIEGNWACLGSPRGVQKGLNGSLKPCESQCLPSHTCANALPSFPLLSSSLSPSQLSAFPGGSQNQHNCSPGGATSYHSGATGWALLFTSQWMPGAQPGVSAELWLVSTGRGCLEAVSGPTFGSDNNKRLRLLSHVPSLSYHPTMGCKGNLCDLLGVQASYPSHGLPNAT